MGRKALKDITIDNAMKVINCLYKNNMFMTRAEIANVIDIAPPLVTDIFKNIHLKRYFIKSRKVGELMKYELSELGKNVTRKNLANLSSGAALEEEKINNSRALFSILVPRVGELYC